MKLETDQKGILVRLEMIQAYERNSCHRRHYLPVRFPHCTIDERTSPNYRQISIDPVEDGQFQRRGPFGERRDSDPVKRVRICRHAEAGAVYSGHKTFDRIYFENVHLGRGTQTALDGPAQP